MNAVDIQGVRQRYGNMTVLHGLDLSLGEGEVLGLFGHNGAGKTTSMIIAEQADKWAFFFKNIGVVPVYPVKAAAAAKAK